MPDLDIQSAQTPEEPAKGERTRLRITESACRLFIDQGYHGTSMRQIAQAADLALGSIYNHFTTKDEIFAAVLDTYHPWREIPAAVEAAQGATDEETLRDAARRILAVWSERSDLVRLHSIEQVEFQGQHLPQLYESTVADIIQVVQGSDAVRGIPVPLLVRAYFGLFFAYLAGEQFTKAGLPIDLGQQPVDFFAEAYLQGVLGLAKTVEAKPTEAKTAEAKPGRKWH